MTTWMHEQRLAAAQVAVRRSGARSVLDLGCGDGDFLTRLLSEPLVDRIVGLDLCRESLDRLRRRLAAAPARCKARVDLIHGSMTESRAVLAGFDCAVLIEAIEHIELERLTDLERVVFAEMRPATVVITTPNAEFNPLLGVPSRRFRHPDHKFEWDRARFQRWAVGLAARNGYGVTLEDIAGHHPALGGASQMAVFEATARAGHRSAA